MEKKNRDIEEIIRKIDEKSPYRKKDSGERKYMTVHEMGDLLGIRKTDRYWLVHKGFFKTETILGKMRVEIASFEKWYANQVKYHKITGEEPGLELKKKSYSVYDLMDLLGVSEWTVRDIIQKNHIKTVIVDYWMRVPREEFMKWYEKQNRYRMKEDRQKDKEVESSSISMPEMARILGTSRQNVYCILVSKKYQGIFEYVCLAEQKRVTRESFERFLKIQDKYQKVEMVTEEDKKKQEDAKAVPSDDEDVDTALELEFEWRREIEEMRKKEEKPYLTLDEAADLAHVTRSTISKWYLAGLFPVKRIGRKVLVLKEEYMEWLNTKKEEM